MAKSAEATGPLALSPRPRDAAHALTQSVRGSTAFSAASVLPRGAAQRAEIAQARVFERLLQDECAELESLADRGGPDDSDPSGELTHIRARLDEVESLLRALRGRFPHSAPNADR